MKKPLGDQAGEDYYPKWIACYPEGCEAWAEQRRTGYPRLFPVLVNKKQWAIDTRTMIRRLNFRLALFR